MTRSILAGLLGLFSIAAVGALPLACQSGGIGDPCIPEDEYSSAFAGFKLTEENIESRSFQCSTRICLVNHFQGRTSCPEGQPPPLLCHPNDPKNPGKDVGDCADAAHLNDPKTTALCVEGDVIAPDCVPPADCATADDCPNKGACTNKKCADPCPNGLSCDAERKVCACSVARDGYECVLSDSADDKSVTVLKSFVCHKPGNCQVEGAGSAANKGKDCCVPGTDTPTTSAVCGQCGKEDENKRKISTRSAESAVYCSCRCGTAEGAIDPEDDFNFCECPTGFSCSEVRPSVGIGDVLTTGKYCVKDGTEYKRETVGECNGVTGFIDNTTCSQ